MKHSLSNGIMCDFIMLIYLFPTPTAVSCIILYCSPAKGALRAAEFLTHADSGLYDMQDVLGLK